MIGRIQTNGPKDFEAVHRIQDGLHLAPLSESAPVKPQFDPNIDMATPPPLQIAAMPAAKFFSLAAEDLKTDAPHLTDQPILARLRRIGIEPGKGFDLATVGPAVRHGIERAVAEAPKLMAQGIGAAMRRNGWVVPVPIGTYGTNYLLRAIVARTGLGANLPEDAVYFSSSRDGDGNALSGSNRYVIHFDKGQLPPADAFWSITLYDPSGYPVANPINRFAVGDRDELKYGEDGSLDVRIEAPPGPDDRANWLPAPTGPFNLSLRLYAPRPQAVDGRWTPPPVRAQP